MWAMIISIAYKFSKRKYCFISEEVSLIALFSIISPPTILSSLLSAKYLQPILNCNNSKVESSPPISAKICHPIKILNAHNWVEQGSLLGTILSNQILQFWSFFLLHAIVECLHVVQFDMYNLPNRLSVFLWLSRHI